MTTNNDLDKIFMLKKLFESFFLTQTFNTCIKVTEIITWCVDGKNYNSYWRLE